MAGRDDNDRQPTIVDVAHHAGVSAATAGRALGGYGSVRKSTRDAVLKAAGEVGYEPNTIARSMITGRTNTLGVVVADIENPFFSRAVRSIADVARDRGYDVIVANTDERSTLEEQAIRVLLAQRVDGLIVSPARVDRGAHIEQAADKGTPVVLLDREVDGVELDSVMIENRTAARMGVQHLVDLGHRRIGVTAIGYSMTATAEERAPAMVHSLQLRVDGWRDGLRAAGIEPDDDLFGMCEYSSDAAAAVYSRQLALADPPTALLATDDITTMGALKAVQQHGLSIPDDVSVLGFDDAEWMTVVQPPVTVIAQPTRDLGAMACERLLARIGRDKDGGSVAHTTLPARLVERSSTGPVPRASTARSQP